MRLSRGIGRVAVTVVLAFVHARRAGAACTPSDVSRCSIDLFQGPVLAPARTTGLGGAFAAYAEGVDAIAANGAAVAVRPPYSSGWFDYDVTLGVSFPAAFRSTDFDNDGSTGFTYENFLFYTLGAQLQLGPYGVGVLGDFQRYDLLPSQRSDDPQVTETLGRVHAVIGRSFWHGQVSVAGGVRAVTLSIDSTEAGSSTNRLQMTGAAPQVSLLVRPDFLPWRLGATFRAPVEGRARSSGPEDIGKAPFVPPASLFLPWELEMGAAIQVGPRPLNPTWLDPHEQEWREQRQIDDERAARKAAQEVELRGIADPGRMFERARELSYQEKYIRRDEEKRMQDARERLLLERKARYANWPRERITVLMAILVTGKSPDALGLESFFSQQASLVALSSRPTWMPSGRAISYSPRLGLEGEPVPDRLQTRIGTYIEPSRFGGLARQHFTFGFDVKLAAWSVFGLVGDQIWRIGAVADLAPRYQSFGLSLGAWH